MKPSVIRSGRTVFASGPSNHVYNQSLLATMIKRFGEAKVETMVRGLWPTTPI